MFLKISRHFSYDFVEIFLGKDTPVGSHRLLLALRSRITHGTDWSHMRFWKLNLGLFACNESTFTIVLSPASTNFF